MYLSGNHVGLPMLRQRAQGGWTPAMLGSGRLAEFNAKTQGSVTTWGGEVTTWSDLSDNNLDLTASGTPDHNTAGFITFNSGDSEYLKRSITDSDYRLLTHFEWHGIIYCDSTNIYRPMVFKEIGGTNNWWLELQVGSDNKCRIYAKEASLRTDLKTDNALSDGYNFVSLVMDGSSYKFRFGSSDSVEAVTVSGGTDTGEMIGDFTTPANFDEFQVSAVIKSSPSYSSNKERYQLHMNRASTAAERANIYNYINNNFAIN